MESSHLFNCLEAREINHSYKPGAPDVRGEYWSINRCDGRASIANLLPFDGIANFLFESDSNTKEEQLAFLEKHEDKIAMAVWSGSKSMHFTFQVKGADCYLLENYKTIWQNICNSFPELTWDKSSCNPVKLTRMPKSIRKDKGTEQTLWHFAPDNFLEVDFASIDLETRVKQILAEEENKLRLKHQPSNVDSRRFIANYMKKHDIEYTTGCRQNVLCKVRGALKRAGVPYNNCDLIVCGFDSDIIKATSNLGE